MKVKFKHVHIHYMHQIDMIMQVSHTRNLYEPCAQFAGNLVLITESTFSLPFNWREGGPIKPQCCCGFAGA